MVWKAEGEIGLNKGKFDEFPVDNNLIIPFRCRCKVGLEMQNFYEFRPMVRKCHLMHFNDNKYKFESKRKKHVNDKGDVTAPSPLAILLAKLP